MSQVLVLGYFGHNTNQLDGQTIKTRSLYQLLCGYYSDVDFFDTQDFKYNAASFFKMLNKVFHAKNVCYLPAQNNLKFIFPIIFILSKISKNNLIYIVIGGWLSDFLVKLPLHRWMLKRIKAIFPETQLMYEQLKNHYQISNIQVLPNFRISDFKPNVTRQTTRKQMRLVFMARINKMKGYDTIFNFAEYAHNKGLDVIVDFYGQINENDKTDFLKKVANNAIVSYKGAIMPEDIYQVLCRYDLLLLPTKYYTEGFPGSVLDAYIAGIPVVVTEWQHSHEFVIDGRTGYIVPFCDNQGDFNDKLTCLYFNREILAEMKNNAIEFSNRFRASNIIHTLDNYLL